MEFNIFYFIWAHPREGAGSGFPLLVLAMLRANRFNPLRSSPQLAFVSKRHFFLD
jgi:hypothetical protein